MLSRREPPCRSPATATSPTRRGLIFTAWLAGALGWGYGADARTRTENLSLTRSLKGRSCRPNPSPEQGKRHRRMLADAPGREPAGAGLVQLISSAFASHGARLGVSPSAARGRLGQVDRAGARATSSTPLPTPQNVALAAVRASCQTPEAPAREGHRPDHHHTRDPDVTEVPSPEAGARVQGGAPGRRRPLSFHPLIPSAAVSLLWTARAATRRSF